MDTGLIVSIIFGVIGFGFGIWQNRSASNLKKVVNDNVRGLYRESQRILELAKNKKDHSGIEEGSRALKYSIIQLDMVNRNLNNKKIDQLLEKEILTEGEAHEYKLFSSS